MSAQGVWAGLGDSAFLAGVEDRERDPGRLAMTLLGGATLGLVAAVCCRLLVLVVLAIDLGHGAGGLDGLIAAEGELESVSIDSPTLSVFRLMMASADGALWVVFTTFAAVVGRHTIYTYVTAAARVRWRLFGVGMILSAAATTPLVVAERLVSIEATASPILSVSPFPSVRVIYCLASLLLIPAAIAEELFFRGWLMRQTGAFLKRPLVLIALTSLVFSAAHREFEPDAFLNRALMGVGFAYMTLRLGGIEFAAGAHAVNNLMIVLFLHPLNSELTQQTDSGAFSMVEDAALVGGYVLITELVARLPTLRRWAGVRAEDISPSRDVSAHFS